MSRRRRLTAGSGAVLVAMALALPALAGGAIDLQDVFEADGILDRALFSTLEELEVRGPAPEPSGSINFVCNSFAGIRWAGFPLGTDPTDPANLALKESRITLEFWFPQQIDFQDLDSAWLFLQQGGDPASDFEGLRLKKIMGRKLARQGIPSAIWYETDLHPVIPGQPVLPVAEQLGYNNDGQLLQTGLTWMMLKDPDVEPLDIQDFRFHFRFGMAQAYMLSTTFVQRYLEDYFGPQSSTWVASLRSIVAGGSKRGTAALTASGIDPRIRGARISGSQSFNADELGAWARYIKDWYECPGGQLGARADFVQWAEQHEGDSPSYYDVYAPDRSIERYQNVLFLDIVATHDYINPLGSHSTFWPRHDGLQDGLPDPTEQEIAHRVLRRQNVDHGIEVAVGQSGPFAVSKSLVLVWRLVRHLALGRDLPRIDAVDVDVSGATEWTVQVRVEGQHDPADEQYTVFVAMSDDRDFRRCAGIERAKNAPCYQWPGDDNKDAEDIFIAVTPSQIVTNGNLRELTFAVPAERGDFAATPVVATFVELVIEGNNPNRFGDDIWLDTEVVFRNDQFYTPFFCP